MCSSSLTNRKPIVLPSFRRTTTRPLSGRCSLSPFELHISTSSMRLINVPTYPYIPLELKLWFLLGQIGNTDHWVLYRSVLTIDNLACEYTAINLTVYPTSIILPILHTKPRTKAGLTFAMLPSSIRNIAAYLPLPVPLQTAAVPSYHNAPPVQTSANECHRYPCR
ncbi:hypothetical protein D3C85_1298030 [compost metagenome]